MSTPIELSNRERRSNMRERVEKTIEKIGNNELFVLKKKKYQNEEGESFRYFMVGMNSRKIDNPVVNTLEATSTILERRHTHTFSEEEYRHGLMRNAQSLDISEEELETNTLLFNHYRMLKTLEATILVNDLKEEGEYSEEEYIYNIERNAQSLNITTDELLSLSSQLLQERANAKEEELI